MNFDSLIHSIADVHTQLQASATKAVNISLTLRNWLIGGYIAEYELKGEDRAKYGDKLMERLAAALRKRGVPSCDRPRLSCYLSLYRSYPQIRETLSPESRSAILLGNPALHSQVIRIYRSLSDKFTGSAPALEIEGSEICRSSSDKLADTTETTDVAGPEICRTASDKSLLPTLRTPGRILLDRLPYSHLELLAPLDPPIKRTFYEIECIKGCWSFRELKRQIASLYFERSGLSRDKEALSRMANEAAESEAPALVIRDPFVFDFLGIHAADALSESELEAALMKHLQRFLLELGRGFCFEAQQKRLLIGGEYFFCDLVFYHRILKCHVLIELKTEAFSHEHLGQLNAYVAYYREHEMQPGDQPPVGILLCTQQNQALVKYALAGMDQGLFVSRYQMQLPEAKELEAFLQRELKLWEEQHA